MFHFLDFDSILQMKNLLDFIFDEGLKTNQSKSNSSNRDGYLQICPWDLPRAESEGQSESYFFCKRGRKYRNSVRPNRVTGSGFWKATGIDRAVYSHGSEDHQCIGLKKTLVYCRGNAGKGTKTDWMMHEFRLPRQDNHTDTTQKA
ncbi:hypothetical protein Gotri_011387, partial [Gossypium trilobum]|nr:hypothetical protein [Gossypium trilobum]